MKQPALPQLKRMAALLAAAFFAMITYNAWVAEDAYLTFRVVDNAVHGYGLRWNIDQRVQAYTNPLWMLLLIPFFAVTGEIFYTSIAVSLLVNAGMARRLHQHYRSQPLLLALLFFLLLCSSRFIDFAVCGLENPLTFALTAAFTLSFLQDLPERTKLRRLFFFGALMVVNRMDLVIIAAPAIFHQMLAMRWRPSFKDMLWGWPAVAWFGFSILYYGTPFPNTYYAKLTAGVAKDTYRYFGSEYVKDIFINDLPTAMVLVAGLLLTVAAWVWMALRRLPLRSDAARLAFLGLGPSMYCYYVYSVGGDFMSGRFWTPPFFAFVLLLLHGVSRLPARLHWRACAGMAALLLCTVAGRHMLEDKDMKAPIPTFEIGMVPPSGIVNERSQYFGTNALRGDARPQQHVWPMEQLKLHEERVVLGGLPGPDLAVTNAAGMVGYYLGPQVIVLDTFALADPLIARLPTFHAWRAGHNSRHLPEGYIYFRQTGDDSQMQPDLRAFNRAISLVVSGDIFSRERFKAMWALHTGALNGLVQAYLASLDEPES